MSAGLLKLVEKQNKDLRDEVARLREALVQKETQIETLLRRKERLEREVRGYPPLDDEGVPMVRDHEQAPWRKQAALTPQGGKGVEG